MTIVMANALTMEGERASRLRDIEGVPSGTSRINPTHFMFSVNRLGWGTRCIGCRMTRLGFGLCMRVNPKRIKRPQGVLSEEVTLLEQSALWVGVTYTSICE